MPKWVSPSMIRYRMLFVQTSKHAPKTYQKLSEHERFCMQNNQLPTKSHVKLEDNCIVCKNSQWKITRDQLPMTSPIKLKDTSNDFTTKFAWPNFRTQSLSHYGQAHFSMPRGAKVSLALDESNRNRLLLFIQIQTLPPSIHHHKRKEMVDIICRTINEKSQGTNSRRKVPLRSRINSKEPLHYRIAKFQELY
jgi:hypothetical protein